MTYFKTKMTRLENTRTDVTHFDKRKNQNDALCKYEDFFATKEELYYMIAVYINTL
jgi:hypothetical protein